MVNEWTRDDLPAVMDLVKASVDAVATDPSGGAYAALDAVVDHLNEHHPKPDAQADAEWLEAADPVEAKAVELWRAAYPDTSRDWEEVGQVRDAYRRMAAHVLGQEDRHVDQ